MTERLEEYLYCTQNVSLSFKNKNGHGQCNFNVNAKCLKLNRSCQSTKKREHQELTGNGKKVRFPG